MEHRLRRKHLQLNSDANASSETYLKKKEKRNFRSKKNGKHEKIKEMKNMKAEVALKWAIPNLPSLSTEAQKTNFHKRKS